MAEEVLDGHCHRVGVRNQLMYKKFLLALACFFVVVVVRFVRVQKRMTLCVSGCFGFVSRVYNVNNLIHISNLRRSYCFFLF